MNLKKKQQQPPTIRSGEWYRIEAFRTYNASAHEPVEPDMTYLDGQLLPTPQEEQ